VALMTEPCGAMLPTGKQTVLVSPFSRERAGDMITSFDRRHREPSALRGGAIGVLIFPTTRASCERFTRHSEAVEVEQIELAEMQHDFRHTPRQKTRIVGCPTGPFGSASTSRGTRRLISIQS